MPAAINFPAFDPVALDLGFFQIHWYALAYIAGLLLGWWYIGRMLADKWWPNGPPLTKKQAEDLVFYIMLGVVLGGRLGYVLFYKFADYIAHPLHILKVWEGGMSFHGGLLGVIAAILAFAIRNKTDPFMLSDLVAIVAPIGLFFGRLANFINGELWGRVTDVQWGMIFPRGGPLPRHPSQLYQAFFEGVLLVLVVAAVWKLTDGRRRPGLLTGVFCAGYGVARIAGETAPLLFTALSNQFWSSDMSSPMASLPVTIFKFAMSPYENWQKLAWAGVFLITAGVLALNILARVLFRQR